MINVRLHSRPQIEHRLMDKQKLSMNIIKINKLINESKLERKISRYFSLNNSSDSFQTRLTKDILRRKKRAKQLKIDQKTSVFKWKTQPSLV